MGFVRELMQNKDEHFYLMEREALLENRWCLTQNLIKTLTNFDKDVLVCSVIKCYSCNQQVVGIKFEDFENLSSEYKCFWIRGSVLYKMYCEGTFRDMSKSTNIINNEEEIIMEDFKVVKISFCEGSNTSSVYPYALIDDIALTVGDLVVVKPAHHPITLARVVGFENEPSANDVHFASQGREIINKVDTSAYEQRIKNRKRKAELKREMDKLVSENKELVLYAAVAENNPKMAELLNEYKNLI